MDHYRSLFITYEKLGKGELLPSTLLPNVKATFQFVELNAGDSKQFTCTFSLLLE